MHDVKCNRVNVKSQKYPLFRLAYMKHICEHARSFVDLLYFRFGLDAMLLCCVHER